MCITLNVLIFAFKFECAVMISDFTDFYCILKAMWIKSRCQHLFALKRDNTKKIGKKEERKVILKYRKRIETFFFVRLLTKIYRLNFYKVKSLIF